MTATNRFSRYLKRALCVLISILIISAAGVLSYAAADSTPSGGLDVEITLDKETYSAGETVTVMLSITNNTGRKIENVSARYYIPDCFEVSEGSLAELGALNSRQTVRTQLQAVAKTDVGSSVESIVGEKDNTVLYIVLIIVSVAIFLLSVALLFIREKNRRKIAATISFIFALIFCLSPFFTATMPISADASDLIFADDISYENAKAVISRLVPDDYTKINPLISSGNTLTRESAAIISAIMILGENGLPEVSDDPYLDVSADSASAPYIKLSASHDIVPSISANRFDPSATVSGYDFVRYVLRAAGFGENGEYRGQNARARVIADALSLPYTDASELLTEDNISCSKALSFALSVMLNPSAEKTESGTYTLTAPSLISRFAGVTETKALAANRNALTLEDGTRLDVHTKSLEDSAYTVTFINGAPLTLIKNFSSLGYSIIPVYSSGKSLDLGVGIEYTVPSPKSDYQIYRGLLHTDPETGLSVFTSDNTHYTVSEKAFENAIYMLDAKISDKPLINYEKSVIFIAKIEKDSAIRKMIEVLYVYQLSSEVSASYDAFNTALANARAINNDKGIFLPSAYEKFVLAINAIDASLPKDLTDTEESRQIIAQAEADLLDAVNTLDKYMLESYDELDKAIEAAEKELAKEGEYTEESFNALKKALEDARAVSRELLLGDESKAIINGAKDLLNAAVSALKPSAYCNYTAYNQTLDVALKINNDDGKYDATEYSNFVKNVNNINSELDKELPRSEANQKRVDNACAAIQDAIERLNSKLPCDYSALDTAISNAESLIASDPENKTHKWKGGAFTAFNTALSDAKKIKRNMTLGYGSTNQQSIDGAATALFNAINALKANENDPFDTTEIKNALGSILTENDGSYSDAAFSLYLSTMNTIKGNIEPIIAEPIYACSSDSCTCNAKVVQKALADIEAAKALKEPLPCVYDKLSEKIAEAGAIDRALYTPSTLLALDAALASADALPKDLLGDVLGANQKLIDDTVAAIDSATKALVKIETVIAEVVSGIEKKEITAEDGTVTEQYFIKIFIDGKEKEFPVDPTTLPESIEKGDVITLSYGGDEIVAIEIARVSLGEFADEVTVKDITKYVSSYKAVEPKAGDTVVFFKNSADEIVFITLSSEKVAEIVYSETKLLVGGKETAVAEGADFSAFSERALVKIVFIGRYAYSAEALSGIDVTLSLTSDKKAVEYKESAEGEAKKLEASKTVFEAGEDSALLVLDKLTEALKAENAAKAYTAKIYLDAEGKLIASGAITAVIETPETPETPENPENPEAPTI